MTLSDLRPGPTAVRSVDRVDLVGLVQEQARRQGRRVCLEDARGGAILFTDLPEELERWAAVLDTAGSGPGAVLGLATADPLAFATAFLGVMGSGRWVAPMDPALIGRGGEALATALDRVGARHVITGRTVTPAAGGWAAAPARRRPGPGGVVLASSGTTGAPKVVRLAERQLLHAARAIAGHHGLSESDRGFNPLPLFHVNAEVVGILASLVGGASLVMEDRFHRRDFWARMARHAVTWINAVPAIVTLLAETAPGERVPAGIRFVRSASAPLPPEALRRFEAATGIPVVETYGMTEAASQITANPLGGPRKPGSVGRPVGVELRITADGRPVSGGRSALGQVEIRGPSVVGRYADGAHRDRFDPDGWLRTGDLGYLDEDGYLFLRGRIDEVINRGGEKVFPREVEECLLGDPDVAAAVVVGRPHDVLGQVPVAFVVLGGGGGGGHGPAAVVTRLRGRLRAELSRAQRPVSIAVVAGLPVGPTGKTPRRALAEGDPPVRYRWVAP